MQCVIVSKSSPLELHFKLITICALRLFPNATKRDINVIKHQPDMWPNKTLTDRPSQPYVLQIPNTCVNQEAFESLRVRFSFTHKMHITIVTFIYEYTRMHLTKYKLLFTCGNFICPFKQLLYTHTASSHAYINRLSFYLKKKVIHGSRNFLIILEDGEF